MRDEHYVTLNVSSGDTLLEDTTYDRTELKRDEVDAPRESVSLKAVGPGIIGNVPLLLRHALAQGKWRFVMVAQIRSYRDHAWVKRLIADNGADGCWVTAKRQVVPSAPEWFALAGPSREQVGVRRYLFACASEHLPGAGATFSTTCGTANCCNPRHLQIKTGSNAVGGRGGLSSSSARQLHGLGGGTGRSAGRPMAAEGAVVSEEVFAEHLRWALATEDPLCSRVSKFDVAEMVQRTDDMRFSPDLFRALCKIVGSEWDAGHGKRLTAMKRTELLRYIPEINDDSVEYGRLFDPAAAFALSCATRLSITLAAEDSEPEWL